MTATGGTCDWIAVESRMNAGIEHRLWFSFHFTHRRSLRHSTVSQSRLDELEQEKAATQAANGEERARLNGEVKGLQVSLRCHPCGPIPLTLGRKPWLAPKVQSHVLGLRPNPFSFLPVYSRRRPVILCLVTWSTVCVSVELGKIWK